MFTNLTNTAADRTARTRANWRLVGTLLGEIAAVASIFAGTWGFLVIGRGLGLN